jgi:hypothetical protein
LPSFSVFSEKRCVIIAPVIGDPKARGNAPMISITRELIFSLVEIFSASFGENE